MNEAQMKFNNFALQLEKRWQEFQVQQPFYDSPAEYWMHRNCVLYDYEIKRLRKFNNPCRACGLPMHLTQNFEIYGVGQICQVCWTLHTIVAASKYFSNLHDIWQAEQNRIKRERFDKGTTA
jgi:hypothetical protein